MLNDVQPQEPEKKAKFPSLTAAEGAFAKQEGKCLLFPRPHENA